MSQLPQRGARGQFPGVVSLLLTLAHDYSIVILLVRRKAIYRKQIGEKLEMARKLRVQFPKACYHIINRGNQRQRIFRRASDYQLFLDKLSGNLEDFKVQLRCFCIMPNHFHLYLRTELANLSRFMQSFLVSFRRRKF